MGYIEFFFFQKKEKVLLNKLIIPQGYLNGISSQKDYLHTYYQLLWLTQFFFDNQILHYPYQTCFHTQEIRAESKYAPAWQQYMVTHLQM